MLIAIINLRDAQSTVNLIAFAQALTVLGLPALALTLIYLGTRPDLTGERKVPRWILTLALLAARTATVVLGKMGL